MCAVLTQIRLEDEQKDAEVKKINKDKAEKRHEENEKKKAPMI
jgi:hypothetical protein